MDSDSAAYRGIHAPKLEVKRQDLPDGSVILSPVKALDPHPHRFTERLIHWANHKPDQTFLMRRNRSGGWDSLTYKDTLANVERIAGSLLQYPLSEANPLVILSENSIEHALMTLAALHVGMPCSSLSPSYSLRTTDFNRLEFMINLLTPGLIFVQDGKRFERALEKVSAGFPVVTVSNPAGSLRCDLLSDFTAYPLNESQLEEVQRRHEAVRPDTVAKVLFTSGSTDVPKAVINTHGNISANWQQIVQVFPFLTGYNQEFVDWLPWNHTYGSNHNFGLCLYVGGTFVIDDGNPTPAGVEATVANLKDRKPTVYFSVPRGLEVLIPYFRKDRSLASNFFSNLKMLFFAGAGMPQHVWDAWQEIAMNTIGQKITIATGLGCTESCPAALFVNQPGGYEGLIGFPAPGLEVKVVSKGEKLELRYRGPNITPGYWRQPERTKGAFDEDHFYCTGDAVRFVDDADHSKGLLFDGRLTEDFKLSTGTWVNAGALRRKLILEGNGLIQDAVITGHSQSFAGAVVFLNVTVASEILRFSTTDLAAIASSEKIKSRVRVALDAVASASSGGSPVIKRAIIADFNVRPELGELTDKGSVNQSAVLRNHADIVGRIHAAQPDREVIVLHQKPASAERLHAKS